MILPRDHIRRILSGRKTEARRPTNYVELKVGKVYPVQHEPKVEAMCRVRVVECTREQLGEIDPKGAWNEGFKTRDAFFAWFEARFGSAERDRPVFVVRFALVNVDPPRLMARQNGLLTPEQYVSSAAGALPHEPEAVPRADQDRFSMEAGQAGVANVSAAAAFRREEWSLSQRLARVESMAHVDNSSHLRVVKKRIEEMERRGEAA